MAGRIHIDLFTTLDGVAQAPGGPQEDTTGGFPYGGWQAPFPDEVIGKTIWDGISNLDALLLGRRTYDIFAGYWPNQTGGIAEVFNRVPKYVASRGLPTLDWEGSSQLGMDFAREAEALRERHDSIDVIGSANLVQTLLGQGPFAFGHTDGPRHIAQLQDPQAIALDPDAPTLWIADTLAPARAHLDVRGHRRHV